MDLAGLAEDLEQWLADAQETGPLRDALAPYARDTTKVGGIVRAMGEQARTRLADELFAVAARAGAGAEHYTEFYHQAELMITATSATVRLLHAGKLSDRRKAAWLLARNFFTTMQATILACGGDFSRLAGGPGQA